MDFARAWFEAEETTSNMRAMEKPSIRCQQVHEEMRELSETGFLCTIADARQGLVPDADAIKKCTKGGTSCLAFAYPFIVNIFYMSR